jgi:hypothetical protein
MWRALLAAVALWVTVAMGLLWPISASDRRALQPAVALDRPLPQFVNIRSPQEYLGAMAIGSTTTDKHVNVSFDPIHLYLFSVIPDVVDKQVYLLFEFLWSEMQPVKSLAFSNCSGHYCPTDALPHLREKSFGDLRCEFIAPDGRVLAEAPTPVVAREVDLVSVSTVNTFVGTCAMPEQFSKMVADDAYNGTNSPQVRLLRQGDVGAGPSATASWGTGAFEPHDGWVCMHMRQTPEGDMSAEACAGVCHARSKRGSDSDCFAWNWHSVKKVCWTGEHMPVLDVCQRRPGWVGELRRHPAWDQVDTHRERKRLITFGLGMPLFGDSSYMLRVPQWIECVGAWAAWTVLHAAVGTAWRGVRGGETSGSCTGRTDRNCIRLARGAHTPRALDACLSVCARDLLMR